MNKKKIVIIGGGAGGLSLATRLGQRCEEDLVDVTLVDQNDYHVWKPFLHKYAMGKLNRRGDKIHFEEHGKQNGYQFVRGKISALNRRRQLVSLDNKVSIYYDYLIMALGSRTNDFHIEGVEAHAWFLDGTKQAELLSHRIEMHFENFGNPLTVNLVGAGPTGVELAAELEQKYKGNVQINLFEAGERILPSLPEDVALRCQKALSKKGVRVECNAQVKEVKELGLQLADGRYCYGDLTVWCAGIRGQKVLSELDSLAVSANNRLVVDRFLKTNDERVYAMGDCCVCLQEDGSQVPARAQAAHQMADYLSSSIIKRLREESLEPFHYHDKGSIVSIGQSKAFAVLNSGIKLDGWLASQAYHGLYRKHQAQLLGVWNTLSYVAKSRGLS